MTGALLLAAVTVVVAAVVGVVAFDFDDRFFDEDTPSVEFRFEYDADAESLTVTHRSGRTLQGDRVASVSGGATLATWANESTVTAGDAITIDGVAADRTVTVIWYDEDGDRRELRSWRGPAA